MEPIFDVVRRAYEAFCEAHDDEPRQIRVCGADFAEMGYRSEPAASLRPTAEAMPLVAAFHARMRAALPRDWTGCSYNGVPLFVDDAVPARAPLCLATLQ